MTAILLSILIGIKPILVVTGIVALIIAILWICIGVCLGLNLFTEGMGGGSNAEMRRRAKFVARMNNRFSS